MGVSNYQLSEEEKEGTESDILREIMEESQEDERLELDRENDGGHGTSLNFLNINRNNNNNNKKVSFTENLTQFETE